jgi:hypothetical protein
LPAVIDEEYDSIAAAKTAAVNAGGGEGQMRSYAILVTTLTAMVSLPVAASAQSATAGPDGQAEARASAAENTAVTDRYLTGVETELIGRVDSGKAVVGQEVDARTRQAATLANGTELPRGTKLVGHVTRVQAQSKDQPFAMLALTFDHAELKGGQNVALRSVIRMVAPLGNVSASDGGMGMMGPGVSMANPGPVVTPAGGGGLGTGGRSSTGTRGGGGPGGGSLGGGGLGGGLPGTTGGTAGTTVPSVGDTTETPIGGATADTRTLGGSAAATPDRRVSEAGESVSGAPRATGLPGVMLWASPNVSGMLTAAGRNISLESGTQITLGVITR